jgi:hypothetical protein
MAGVLMNHDQDKVDEVVLALLCLTLHDEHGGSARAWKEHDWNVLDRLHEKGWIDDPKNKAKSVLFTPEGLARAREMFEQHFGKSS